MPTDWTEAPRTPERMPRRRLGIVVGALLVVAAGVAALVVLGGEDEEAPPPERASAEIRVRVVDEALTPLPQAEVFVLAGEDLPPGGSGRWSEDEATLFLPPVVRGSAVAAQAKGYRSGVAKRVVDDMDLVLRRGLLARFEVRGADAEALGDAVLVFQVVPAPADDRSEEEMAKIVALIDTVVPPPEGAQMLPAGPFGFAVQAAVARLGLLLPMAGRYVVRWGLLDPGSGMWFALPERVRSVVNVADDPRGQVFTIDVDGTTLELTRRGLAERVRRMTSGD